MNFSKIEKAKNLNGQKLKLVATRLFGYEPSRIQRTLLE